MASLLPETVASGALPLIVCRCATPPASAAPVRLAAAVPPGSVPCPRMVSRPSPSPVLRRASTPPVRVGWMVGASTRRSDMAGYPSGAPLHVQQHVGYARRLLGPGCGRSLGRGAVVGLRQLRPQPACGADEVAE